ncbi:UNVERIFIED_CONTAM: hypothetical protein FKN15_003711 [Acipenser sinensis]
MQILYLDELDRQSALPNASASDNDDFIMFLGRGVQHCSHRNNRTTPGSTRTTREEKTDSGSRAHACVFFFNPVMLSQEFCLASERTH